jgi:hypothetical protein
MTAIAVATESQDPGRHPDWTSLTQRAPQLVITAWRYLDQIALSLRPATVAAADTALRGLAQHLAGEGVDRFSDVQRRHIETYKQWLAHGGTQQGRPPARNTVRQRLGLVRSFFDRIIEWDWADSPARTPMFAIDFPSPTTRCRGSSTTLKPLASWPQQQAPTRWTVSSSSSSPAPGYGPANSATSNPTPSVVSAAPGGCASRSASSTTTATSRCTPDWLSCSATGGQDRTDYSSSTADPWTVTESDASSAASPEPPASATSTPTRLPAAVVEGVDAGF